MNASPPSDPARLTLSAGVSIAYHRRLGKGPGVIFCGGYSSDMTGTKATFLERWCGERGQAFVRFDYQGHGASSGRFEEGTLGQWTGDAVAVIDHLTEGPQILIGSSLGGWIMLLATRQRPERIAALIGIACAADFSENLLWQRMDDVTRARLRRDGVIYPPAENPNEKPYGITLDFIEEARRHLLLNNTLLPITCPVRLLHGMRDTSVPWQTSAQVAERLVGDDVQVILVKDGEHTLSRAKDLALLTEHLDKLIVRCSEDH